MQNQTAEKAPKKEGFFKRAVAKLKETSHERKTKKLLQLSREFGLHLVRIERRAGTDYIVTPKGTYRKIGREEK